MKAEWKTRWLKALRSEEYEQGTGTLRDSFDYEQSGYVPGGVKRFCCLGVLCDIAGVRWKPGDEGCKFGKDSINDIGLTFFGLTDQDQELCVTLNDEKSRSFKQIARTIEAKF